MRACACSCSVSTGSFVLFSTFSFFCLRCALKIPFCRYCVIYVHIIKIWTCKKISSAFIIIITTNFRTFREQNVSLIGRNSLDAHTTTKVAQHIVTSNFVVRSAAVATSKMLNSDVRPVLTRNGIISRRNMCAFQIVLRIQKAALMMRLNRCGYTHAIDQKYTYPTCFYYHSMYLSRTRPRTNLPSVTYAVRCGRFRSTTPPLHVVMCDAAALFSNDVIG